MKTLCRLCFVLTCSLMIGATALAESKPSSALGVGVRHHMAQSSYTDYPFEDGDLSYGLSYEIRDAAGCWQLAVDYAADTAEDQANSADHVVTPQINMLLQDSFWRGGLGIGANYIQYTDEALEASESDENTGDVLEDGWNDIFYQFLLGVSLPLGPVSLDVLAAYPFDNWGDLGDFKGNNIEVALWLKFSI